MKVRKWKQTRFPPALAPGNGDIPAKATAGPDVSDDGPAGPAPSLYFVNTAHPSEATTLETVGHLRSHVARVIHASRRQRRRTVKSGPVVVRARSVSSSEEEGDSDGAAAAADGTAVGALTSFGGRDQADFFAQGSIPCMSGPWTLLGGLSRPLTEFERYLMDFYVQVIIPETFGHDPLLAFNMTYTWLPFVVTDPGLMAGLLLIMCRGRTDVETEDERRAPFAGMAIEYKGECMRGIMRDLAVAARKGAPIRDATLVSVMLMCNHEMKFGNMAAAQCHASAYVKLLEAQGQHSEDETEFLPVMIARFGRTIGAFFDLK